MITLTINDKKIEVAPGTSIIDAADANGIYIPRFCYHRKLSVVANCRMCLVEVEGARKPMPACATLCTEDMKVYTQSKEALAAQRAVMEFLLINHPLDCPICDQGGECELQDLSVGFGCGDSDFDKTKRSVQGDDLGPLVATEMTRCIQCTRCIRFGEEIAGLPELGAVYRGEGMKISTYVKHYLKSELSGNIIDLCPVGALTSKPYRFHARAWELTEHASIAAHDCVGSNVYLHTRAQEYAPQRITMRVVPKANEAINENWLSDRDRFSYLAYSHADRVIEPQVKRNGEWQTQAWEPTLLEIVDRTRAIASEQGADQLAALSSPNSTTEEQYLLQKLMRQLGSNNIDHRLREVDFSDQDRLPLYPTLGTTLLELESASDVLIVGGYTRKEQPLINHRLLKAEQDGANVMVLNSVDYPFNFNVSQKLIVPHADLTVGLAEVVKACGVEHEALTQVTVSATAQTIADKLKAGEKPFVLLGSLALQHPEAAQLRTLAQLLTEKVGVSFGVISEGCNQAGAWLAGAIPHRTAAGHPVSEAGLTAKALLTTRPVRAYFILGSELESDSAYSAAALAALKQAGLVVCLTSFVTEKMRDYADFILPIAPLPENAGTFINGEGVWQSFVAASVPSGQAKPAWKVLRVLGNLFELGGFEFEQVEQIRHEIKQLASSAAEIKQELAPLKPMAASGKLTRLGAWPMVYVDAVTRRADALVRAFSEKAGVYLNSELASEKQLTEGDLVLAKQEDNSEIVLPVVIDDRIANHTVMVFSGLPETMGFGQAFAEIELVKQN